MAGKIFKKWQVRRLAAVALAGLMVLTGIKVVYSTATVFAAETDSVDDPNGGNPVSMVSAEESSHYDGEKNYFSNVEYDSFGLALNAPAEFDPEDGANPIGGDKDETVVMQDMDELFMARGNYHGNKWNSWLTTMEETENATRDDLSFYKMIDQKYGGKEIHYNQDQSETTFRNLGIYKARIQTANAVGFDMDGDGTDELAVTYLLEDLGDGYSYSTTQTIKERQSYRVLRIYDYREDGSQYVVAENAAQLSDWSRIWSNSEANTNWVASIELESSHGLAAITAGDYDRDGKEEVAVYSPCSGKVKSHIDVFKVNGKKLDTLKQINLSELVTDGRFNINYTNSWYVPMCSLATTSISGKDDLVISARNPRYWEFGYGDFNHEDAFAIYRYDGSTMQMVTRSDLTYGNSGIIACSATDGDLNGNGVEELLVGGNWDNVGVGVDENHNGLMAFCWNTEKGGYEQAWSSPMKLEANSDIRSGKVMQAPTAIAAAQLVTYSKKDILFLNGVLFTMNGAKSETGVQEKDNIASANLTKIDRYGLAGTHNGAFILDVAVGHFVRNSINEEQICVITGDYQQTNHDNVNIDYGFVFRNVSEAEKKADFNPRANMNPDDMSNWNLSCVVTSNDIYSQRNEDDDGTYVCICPMDVDHDTYEYTYLGKDYGWSSPTLYAVVNAVPYWKELNYTNGIPGSETWSIKVTDSTTNSGSAGFGIGLFMQLSAGVSAGILQNSGGISATYKMDVGLNWTGTWGKTHATTDTLSLSLAPNKNYAIVYAVPIINYRYKLHSPECVVDRATYDEMKKKDKDWPYKVGDVIPASDEEISIVEQQTPSFSAVPVGTYNNLAKKYDMEQVLYGQNSADDSRYIPERTIGDPTTYPVNNNVFAEPAKVNNGRLAANVNTSQSSTLSHDETDTYNESHNLTAKLNTALSGTVQGSEGFIIVAKESATAGFSLGPSAGYTYSEANTRGVTYGATFSKLPDSCEDYGYTAMLAMYDLPGNEKIEGDNGDDFTPNGRPFVLDYVVKDLKNPAPPEVNLNLRALGTTSDSVLLRWDNPISGERLADHYDFYVMSGEVPVKIGTVSSVQNTFVVKNLNPGTTYIFKMRAVGNSSGGGLFSDSPISVYGNQVTASTLSDSVCFTRQPQSGYVENTEVLPENVNEMEAENKDVSEEDVNTGGSAYTLTAEAQPGTESYPVAYQWQKAVSNSSGKEIFTDISGATEASYTVTADELKESGGRVDYRVYAYLKGGSYGGTYSHIANVVLKKEGINYYSTQTELTISPTAEKDVYTASAEVMTASEDKKPVTEGEVMFYSTPKVTDRDLESADPTGVQILGTAKVEADGKSVLTDPIVATREGCIIGAVYLAETAGTDCYFNSQSNEVAVSADEYVRLTYELNGGTNAAENPDPLILTAESEAILLKDPHRAGYTFAGWMLNGGVLEGGRIDPRSVTEDGVLYAVWKPVTRNTRYELGGGRFAGRLGGISKFTAKMNVPMRRAVRDGYTFAGWYLDEEHTKSLRMIAQGILLRQSTKIGSLSDNAQSLPIKNGTVTIYAAWKPVATTPEPPAIMPEDDSYTEEETPQPEYFEEKDDDTGTGLMWLVIVIIAGAAALAGILIAWKYRRRSRD